MLKLNQEALLKVWLETEPSARSPYGLYGFPPMWKTHSEGDYVLFTRPGRTQARPAPFLPYVEVDGVHSQWQHCGQWVDQGQQSTFETFASSGHANPCARSLRRDDSADEAAGADEERVIERPGG